MYVIEVFVAWPFTGTPRQQVILNLSSVIQSASITEIRFSERYVWLIL